MCGIAGFAGSFDYDVLTAMSAQIAHRGPDDADACLLGSGRASVGLAHRRLSIIDLSASGHEPMGVDCPVCALDASTPAERSRWLIYNGEVYNYRQLRQELEARGHRFRSQTDTEVLLHLWNDEGRAMLGKLNGMFAFALYDGKGNGAAGVQPGDLLIARDGVGVKPLYYSQAEEGLLFASELKAIAAWPGLSRELDLVALNEYLAFLWAPAPRTPFAAVRKVLPGEAMLVREGRIAERWCYYDLPYGRPPFEASEEELTEQLRELFAATVERQLVADVPVGSFLSGGLDSSAIVAMMRRQRPTERFRCYCIGFAEGEGSDAGAPADLPYAQRVAEHLGVDLRTLIVAPSMIDNLERMIYHLDEPQADPAPINSMLIAEAAREDGVKVLMSGAGGDDLFSGYRRHVALGLERWWSWLPRRARSLLAAPARHAAGGGAGAVASHPLGRRLVKALQHADLGPEARLASYFLWSDDSMRASIYGPALRAATTGRAAIDPLLASLERIESERDPLQRMLYLEGKHFVADHNLNYTDKTTMAHGVETRVPFLDLELIDFASRIPSRFKQKGRLSKAILKRAMEPYLPHDVIYRPKTGFGAPLRRWLSVELRERVDEMLSPAALTRRGLFDPAGVRRLIELDRAGRIDAAYLIFGLLC
ncbi:MAG: asnB-1, partial [Acidobacteria bacterium]|nr:asnB-1 [Acidobacteriota bacterium]